MTREELQKLDAIISKRIGKKANALWNKAKQEIYAVDIIKRHITREVNYQTMTPKIVENEQGGVSVAIQGYCSYITQKLDEEFVEVLTQWLKENIDKESLKKWLDEDETK